MEFHMVEVGVIFYFNGEQYVKDSKYKAINTRTGKTRRFELDTTVY